MILSILLVLSYIMYIYKTVYKKSLKIPKG